MINALITSLIGCKGCKMLIIGKRLWVEALLIYINKYISDQRNVWNLLVLKIFEKLI